MARKGVLGQNSIESKDQFLLENSRDSRESFNQVTKVATAVTARKAQILNQTYNSAFRYLNITPDRKELRLERMKEQMKSNKINKIETNFIAKNKKLACTK